MNTRLILITPILLALGCARMGTRQGDESTTVTKIDINERTGKTNAITITETRKTSTRASGVTAGTAASTLKGFQARQDGKNQGLAIRETEQKSDIDKALDVLDRGIDLGARMYGIPTGTRSSATPAAVAVPAGWKLVPQDDPSHPEPEIEHAP